MNDDRTVWNELGDWIFALIAAICLVGLVLAMVICALGVAT